uniref:Uncharacterized protein n=1 Tax=Chromera velia CCMP2878 TaxID=1169474 RepID=A0A0G4FD57_9ALVE|eukprot:Cvel_16450.t1-p1 / transcript=Cvel_16450.t1 / gene=Cvel_16450 / organism=Chromera_velia_CCMP2878 / gene_product=hypothetical protein / transcript_product=hypothetical protein / location=Cvel_scaffold1268:21473-22723(+) / protein_length=83 / sequence_SO=supercontig / SO=protein_coding / is_pseudo=false
MQHEAKSLDEWLCTFRSAALRGVLTLKRGEAPRNRVAEKAYKLFKNCRTFFQKCKQSGVLETQASPLFADDWITDTTRPTLSS